MGINTISAFNHSSYTLYNSNFSKALQTICRSAHYNFWLLEKFLIMSITSWCSFPYTFHYHLSSQRLLFFASCECIAWMYRPTVSNDNGFAIRRRLLSLVQIECYWGLVTWLKKSDSLQRLTCQNLEAGYCVKLWTGCHCLSITTTPCMNGWAYGQD